jgi:hypothetical protein
LALHSALGRRARIARRAGPRRSVGSCREFVISRSPVRLRRDASVFSFPWPPATMETTAGAGKPSFRRHEVRFFWVKVSRGVVTALPNRREDGQLRELWNDYDKHSRSKRRTPRGPRVAAFARRNANHAVLDGEIVKLDDAAPRHSLRASTSSRKSFPLPAIRRCRRIEELESTGVASRDRTRVVSRQRPRFDNGAALRNFHRRCAW